MCLPLKDIGTYILHIFMIHHPCNEDVFLTLFSLIFVFFLLLIHVTAAGHYVRSPSLTDDEFLLQAQTCSCSETPVFVAEYSTSGCEECLKVWTTLRHRTLRSQDCDSDTDLLGGC